jgi:cytochrome P450
MSDAVPRGQIERFDLTHLPAGFIDDPYPYYEALRRHDPIHQCPDGSWLLTRYADCVAVYRSQAMSSDKVRLFTPKFGTTPLLEHHTSSLVFNDPPYHTRVRGTLVDALKPRAIQATVAVLETLVARLLDELAQRRTFDVIDDYASRIPVEIISSLLTVPEAERHELREWSLAILGALEPTLSATQREAGNRAVTEFVDYLRGLVAYRRKHPANTANDVLSTLVQQHDAGALAERELLHNCIFLLNAGHETTTNLIGNAVHCLLTHPDARARLVARPAAIKGAIEEVLRFASPNQLGNREVAAHCTIGNVALRPGDQITLCIGAANRDPDVFVDPDRFDLERKPNHHLAFGSGIHACVGMALARIEGKVALEALLRRFPLLCPAGPPRLRQRVRFRGFERLPVAICPDYLSC